jgi:hypothetical protein
MIKLVEVKNTREFNAMERKAIAHFQLDEIWINPDSILQIKPDETMKNNLSKGYLPGNLDARQEFSRILFGSGNNVSTVTVVGKPEAVVEKIYKGLGKEILTG